MALLALLIDFGSTFTKVVAVDLNAVQVVGRSQAPSTVLTDVREGLLQALSALHERHSLFDQRPSSLDILSGHLALASSSAAGGLRMVVIGLVPGLTLLAARQAALGAGAKVVGSFAFKLASNSIDEIARLRADMVLLTGGTDGGDSATILHNAHLLSDSLISVPVIVAGNQAVAPEICRILQAGGKEVRLTDNVMPRSGVVAVDPARDEIRKLFVERITHARGMSAITELVSVVLPTPMAVLRGVTLGAVGSDQEEGWGEMVVVDVGGATTDVHSIGYGYPAGENVITQGIPEPYAKRTVEGDLGIRFNAATLLGQVGPDRFEVEWRSMFPHLQVSRDEIGRYINHISENTARVPEEKWHRAADAVLARVAADIALERHVGKRERVVTSAGEAWVHYGKDLRNTPRLLATGGVFVHNPYASMILSGSAQDQTDVTVLRPKQPQLYLDSSYLLYAVGLLGGDYPDVAVRLFKTYMTPVAQS
ncbi:MAG TPA: methylaspartate mutase accessory protein GlmL [Candidatus Binatia bacterium]